MIRMAKPPRTASIQMHTQCVHSFFVIHQIQLALAPHSHAAGKGNEMLTVVATTVSNLGIDRTCEPLVGMAGAGRNYPQWHQRGKGYVA